MNVSISALLVAIVGFSCLLSISIAIINNNKLVFSLKLIFKIIIVAISLNLCLNLFNSFDFFDSINNNQQGDSIINNNSDNPNLKASAVMISTNIKTLINSRFGIEKSKFSVSVTLDDENNEEIKLLLVTIRLFDPSIISLSEQISAYVSQQLSVPCTVLISN